MATLRAIETRRYLVRAATMGPSIAIDPFGRIIGELRQGTRGVLTVDVAPRHDLTPYAALGDVFASLCVLASLAGLLTIRVPRPKPVLDPVLTA
jgi:apolipoprotein N-acyltransferase